MARPLRLYRVYDRIVASEIDLAPLRALRSGGPDLQLRLAKEPLRLADFDVYHRIRTAGRLATTFGRSPEGYLVRLHGRADFLIKPRGRRIHARVHGGRDPALLAGQFLSQAAPLVETLCGRHVLHGAGLLYAGQAFVLLGNYGFGKSTLTAALIRAGCRFLSDDALVLQSVPRGVRLQPSIPELRLERRRLLGGLEHAALRPKGEDKYRLYLPQHFCAESRLLRRVFLLHGRRGARCGLEQLGGGDALRVLLNNSFRLDLSNSSWLEEELALFSRLVEGTPPEVFSFPLGFRRLDAVARWLLRQVESGS